MPDEKKEWRSIQIRYIDGDFKEIYKEDLDKIDAINDIIDALHRAKGLVASLKGILGD